MSKPAHSFIRNSSNNLTAGLFSLCRGAVSGTDGVVDCALFIGMLSSFSCYIITISLKVFVLII